MGDIFKAISEREGYEPSEALSRVQKEEEEFKHQEEDANKKFLNLCLEIVQIDEQEKTIKKLKKQKIEELKNFARKS